jgi:hypothetical protein
MVLADIGWLFADWGRFPSPTDTRRKSKFKPRTIVFEFRPAVPIGGEGTGQGNFHKVTNIFIQNPPEGEKKR